MDRQEEVFNKTDDILAGCLERSAGALQEYFFNNFQEISSDFISQINMLCQVAKEQQDKGIKSPVSYMNICYLRSSLYTGSLEFRTALYDERFYLDTTETAHYWKPGFLFQHIDSDMEGIANRIAIYPSLSAFELEEIKRVYTSLHFVYGLHFIRALCRDIVAQSDLSVLKLKDDFKVVFGGHMEKGFPVYPPQENEEADGNTVGETNENGEAEPV